MEQCAFLIRRVLEIDESRSLGFERKAGGYRSANAKYGWEADSKQVARAKDESGPERVVKRR